MSTFDDILDVSAANDITILGGQDVTFTPNGGVARTINVIVDYLVDDESVLSGSWKKDPTIQVTATNSATAGIDLSSWDTSDAILLPPRKGATAITFHLAQAMHQISGQAVFKVT